jgi:ATP-dependent Clp protease ATP-binding subunit ClpC
VFTASGADLVSGQCYFGDLEKRVRRLLDLLEHEKLVWLLPSLAELQQAGRNRSNDSSVLDMILPRLQAGTIRIASELRPGAVDKLAAEAPRLASLFEFARLTEPGRSESLGLAAEWLDRHPGHQRARVTATASQIGEALHTANQFFSAKALPGRLIDLLRSTLHHAAQRGDGDHPLVRGLLLESVAATTGMPLEMLDESRTLNLDALHELFSLRVMGQPEAVSALVGRLAMIKAGLTDPTRPLGVFLFAGPTGTGKTEIAKTLATFLFGSPDRMLRFDMSELRNPGSLTRLTGTAGDGTQRSLASQVRQQPFSLVLLDEFEKADPSVWDLFLQVFDDGRLTDDQGNPADLRHCIIILTSNLGARSAQGAPIGFAAGPSAAFRPAEIESAVRETFRPEFINRIDRILCFRPLDRDTMRSILRARLDEALARRGLRNRPWLIDWDASATEFLLRQGFSPTLGARPLQRAIDRHFLEPFAEAVVRGKLPDREDLIFVYARDDRLAWDLASREESGADRPPATSTPPPSDDPVRILRRIIVQPAGRNSELEELCRRCHELTQMLDLDAFASRKQEAIEAMSEPDFWNNPGRFAILGRTEMIDRIENAVRAASRTLDRLASRTPDRASLRPLLSKLALRIHLLEHAWPDIADQLPAAAFLGVKPADNRDRSARLAGSLSNMYRAWSNQRGMRLERLRHPDWHFLASVDGFAAWRILQHESGLHLGEDGGLGETAAAIVAVAPQPPEPPSLLPDPLVEIAAAALRNTPRPETVRLYQERPTPRVRDRRRNWKTGRLDVVLDGHFDLF